MSYLLRERQMRLGQIGLCFSLATAMVGCSARPASGSQPPQLAVTSLVYQMRCSSTALSFDQRSPMGFSAREVLAATYGSGRRAWLREERGFFHALGTPDIAPSTDFAMVRFVHADEPVTYRNCPELGRESLRMSGFAEVELSRGPILRSAAEFSADGGLNDGSFNTTHPAGGAGIQMLSRVARHEVHIVLHPEKHPGPPADSFWDNECSAARIPSLRQAREEALRASIHALSGKTLICTLGLAKNSGETRIIKSPELDLISMDDPGCDPHHSTNESEGRVELRAAWADATDEIKFIPMVSVGPVRTVGEKGRLLTSTFGFATTRTPLPEKLVDLAPCAAHEDHFWELTGDVRIDGKKAIPESAALLWPATCEREPVVCRFR